MDATIRWGTTQSQPILMIPGPTELPFPVVQAMSQPATIQYDLNFDVKILEPVTLALRDIFQTSRAEVIVMPGSGRTALEAAAISVIEPGDRVLVVVAGVFGSLMREIMTRAGAEVTEHTVEWGRPLDLARLEKDVERVKPKAVSMVHNETSTGTTYPAAEVGRIVQRHGALFMLDTVSSLAGLDVRTDDWGVDFNMTGSQKCLAAPLGMAVVSVSPAAWEAMERRKHKSSSWAYDLLRWKENWIPASAVATSPTAARAASRSRSRPTSRARSASRAGSSSRRASPIASAVTRWRGAPSAPASRRCGSSCFRIPRSSRTPCRASRHPPAWSRPRWSATCATATAS